MTESIQLTVTGMKCGGCESNVSGKLQAIPGVSAVSASFKENRVSIEFDSAQTDIAALTQVITGAGFVVE